MQSNNQWFKLDNAAKIYPPTQTKNWTAMFRMSISLKDEISVPNLEEAIRRILKRFPSFSCKLSKGLFWYYFEHIDGIPPISEDVCNPMTHLRMRENNGFMFRVRYFGNRIAIEFFHAVTDGTGGLTFLLSLVGEYIRITYNQDVPPCKYIFSTDDSPKEEELEDCFIKYARKETISRMERVAYHPTGTAVPLNQLLLVSGTIPSNILKETASKHGVSVGELLTAVLIQSILRIQKEDYPWKRRRPVKVSVPVNIRPFYDAKTMRNFSSYVNPGIDGRLGEYSFEEILTYVKSFMAQNVTEKQLNACFSANVASERNIIIRVMPIFIKNIVLKLGFLLQGDRYVSSTISNMGNIVLPDGIKEYVDKIDFMLGQPALLRSVCSCISCNNKTIITFSRTIDETKVEKYFFSTLVKLGVPVRIESNGRFF